MTSKALIVLVTKYLRSKRLPSVKVPVWTVKDDQDDIIWYDVPLDKGNGDYKVRVEYSGS